MIWKGIIGLASSTAAITAQIGSSPMRLFAKALPQGLNTYPAVAGEIVVNMQTKDFDGASDFDYVHYDFHCYGKTKAEAEETAIILRENFEGASGTYNGVEFNDVRFVDSGSEDYLEDLELYTYSLEESFNIRR